MAMLTLKRLPKSNHSLWLSQISHHLLGMQQHIQTFVGKLGRLLLSNEKVILKLTWQDFPYTLSTC